MAEYNLYAQQQVNITSEKINFFCPSGGLTSNGEQVPSGTGSVCFFSLSTTANLNVPTGNAFTTEETTQNAIPNAVELRTAPASVGGVGSMIVIKELGTYTFDFETCLTTAGAIQLFVSPDLVNFFPIDPGIAGSLVGGTWIHGTVGGQIPQVPWGLCVCPVAGPLSVQPIGGQSIIRHTLTRTL